MNHLVAAPIVADGIVRASFLTHHRGRLIAKNYLSLTGGRPTSYYFGEAAYDVRLRGLRPTLTIGNLCGFINQNAQITILPTLHGRINFCPGSIYLFTCVGIVHSTPGSTHGNS